MNISHARGSVFEIYHSNAKSGAHTLCTTNIIYYYVIIPHTWCFHVVSSALARWGMVFRERPAGPRGGEEGGREGEGGGKALVDGGWHGGGRETERGRPCKGHHSNCPGLPFIPFVWPWGALPRPPPPPSFSYHPTRSHRLIFRPRAGSSKSFLRLIFPSNLHAAVIKGLGRGTSSGASTDAGATGGWF